MHIWNLETFIVNQTSNTGDESERTGRGSDRLRSREEKREKIATKPVAGMKGKKSIFLSLATFHTSKLVKTDLSRVLHPEPGCGR